MTVDYAASRRLARTIDARPRACYDNARVALLLADLPDGTVYVEGWIVCRDIPVTLNGQPAWFFTMHGWLELPDGTILDPTLCDLRHEALPPLYCLAWRYTRDDPRLTDRAPIPGPEHVCLQLAPYRMAYERAMRLALLP